MSAASRVRDGARLLSAALYYFVVLTPVGRLRRIGEAGRLGSPGADADTFWREPAEDVEAGPSADGARPGVLLRLAKLASGPALYGIPAAVIALCLVALLR